MSQHHPRCRVIAQRWTRPRSVHSLQTALEQRQATSHEQPSRARNTLTLPSPHPGGTSGMDTLLENLLDLQHKLEAKAFIRLLTILSADHLYSLLRFGGTAMLVSPSL
jgi:hypothetical protein